MQFSFVLFCGYDALRFSHFSHNTLFVGLLFYIPARAHRHKGRKLRFQEAQRRRHTGYCLLNPPHLHIKSLYPLHLHIKSLYICIRSASRLKLQESTKSPRFKIFPFSPQHFVCGSSFLHPCKSTQTQR